MQTVLSGQMFTCVAVIPYVAYLLRFLVCFFFFFSQTEFCWTCLLGKIVIPGILYLDGVLGQELALTYTVIIVA